MGPNRPLERRKGVWWYTFATLPVGRPTWELRGFSCDPKMVTFQSSWRFGQLQVKRPNLFWVPDVLDTWCQKPWHSSSDLFVTFPSWKVIHQPFSWPKKDHPKNINFDQGFLDDNDTSLPLIISGPYCWSHVREWLEAQRFFKIPPWFVDSLDFWTTQRLLVYCYSSRYHSSWIHILVQFFFEVCEFWFIISKASYVLFFEV